MAYYSKRNKPLSLTVIEEFWEGFKAYIEELISNEEWLIEYSIWYDNCGGYWEGDIEKINRKMAQEIGKRLYPLNNIYKMHDNEIIFDLIEFFFVCVSKEHRYEYTIRINRLFDNFRLKYKLVKGKVKVRHSEVFNKFISYIDFNIPDKEAQKLIITALEKFYNRNFNEQKIGVEKLVDAYQRIMSWEEDDKRKSVAEIVEKVSGGEKDIKAIFNEDLKKMWNTANEFMIRHAEKDKIPITDNDFLEYLFYAYFNAIRFILKKYGYIKEKIGEEEEENELPF
jgi:hypothetical protein